MSIKVSIVIPNYNYGQYLEQCLDSILCQTYDNIEVVFQDNQSTDDSFEIAMRYYSKFKQKGIFFSIGQNDRNYGSGANTAIALTKAHGEIIHVIASDDSIDPTFIERGVSVFNKHANVYMVMMNRKEIDDDGKVRVLEPFYNKNCIIPGEQQAGVFMLAGIALPGQRMVRRCGHIVGAHNRKWTVAGDWYDNFLYSCAGDVAYIKDPLFNYRVHDHNETSESEDNLIGPLEHYLIINAFVGVGNSFNMKKPAQRYDEAVKKLSNMCLRYALKMVLADKTEIAKKYLLLATIWNEEIQNEKDYISLQKIIVENDYSNIEELKKSVLVRSVSYDPPEGFIEIDGDGNVI